MLTTCDSRTAHLLESIHRSHRKVRTLDDLLGIQLEPTSLPVKCVIDPFLPNPGTITSDKLTKAWILYNANAQNGDPQVWAPTLNTLGQRLRWKVYTTLLKLRVI